METRVRRWGTDVVWLAALAAIIWGVYECNRWLESRAVEQRAPWEVGPLPDGNTLRVASLGFERLVADLFWLRTVYYIGDEDVTRAGYPDAPRLATLVTDIDPYFTTAYILMNSVLSVLMGEPQLAHDLVAKGLRYDDGSWRLHFLQGFTLFFDLGDHGAAAEHMRAAFERGGPPYLQLLAARLYAEAGAPETAMAFIEARLREEHTAEGRRRLEQRYRDLWIERDLQRVDQALRVFERERGRPAASYAELLDAGLLIPEPRDPEGAAYFLEEGRPATPYPHEPLRVHRQARP